MKTIVDYIRENKIYEHDVMGRDFKLELFGVNIMLTHNKTSYLIEQSIESEIIIREILEENGIEIRFCEECGKPFDAGFMADDGFWYSCEECFESAMDKTYGKGKWRSTEEEGEWGGFYEYQEVDGTWKNTSIFYTEWY